MGEDSEIDVCPKCGSKKVEVSWDFISGIRIFIHCLECHYLEAINQNPEPDPPEPSDEGNPWQTDPDFWKQDDVPD